MRKIYIIVQGSRGRSELTTTIFSSEKRAKKFCDDLNKAPEPSMGWRSYYSYKEVILK